MSVKLHQWQKDVRDVQNQASWGEWFEWLDNQAKLHKKDKQPAYIEYRNWQPY